MRRNNDSQARGGLLPRGGRHLPATDASSAAAPRQVTPAVPASPASTAALPADQAEFLSTPGLRSRAPRRAAPRRSSGRRSSTARRSSASTASPSSRRSSTTPTRRTARSRPGGCAAASSASSGRARSTSRPSRRSADGQRPDPARVRGACALGEFLAAPGIAACAHGARHRRRRPACAPPRRAPSAA